jgi:hypothetical protein
VPTSITVIQTADFIRARADGRLDLETSRKLLVEVVSAVRSAGEHNVIIDTRAAGPTRLAAADLWTLGIAAGTQPALARARVALLVPAEKQDDAEFFENVARVEGVDVRAFTSFESAISWLIMREQSPA